MFVKTTFYQSRIKNSNCLLGMLSGKWSIKKQVKKERIWPDAVRSQRDSNYTCVTFNICTYIRIALQISSSNNSKSIFVYINYTI